MSRADFLFKGIGIFSHDSRAIRDLFQNDDVAMRPAEAAGIRIIAIHRVLEDQGQNVAGFE